MFNIQGRFIKIWKCEVKEKMVLCDVSTSKKNQDGTYTNSNYYGAKFVGKCYDKAKQLEKGNSIEIKSGMIGKREWEKKFYDEVVVFEFELEEAKTGTKPEVKTDGGFDFGGGFVPVEGEDDLPF